jgi:hypothetical protein
LTLRGKFGDTAAHATLRGSTCENDDLMPTTPDTMPPATVSPVPPPIPPAMAQPSQVRLALLLNLLSIILLGPLAFMADLAHLRQLMASADMSMLSFAAYMLFGLAIALTLMSLIHRGKNWARITLVLLFSLGLLPMLAQLPGDLTRAPLLACIHLVQILLQAIGLFLLFGRASNAWFRSLAPTLPAVSDSGPVPRSQFVSVTAWILIGLSALCALGAFGMAGLFRIFVDKDTSVIVKTMLDGAFSDHTPPSVTFLFDNAATILTAIAFSFLLQMAAAIGMLQRKNWGRIATIGFLLASIVISLAGGIGFHFGMEGVMRFALKNMQGPERQMVEEGLKNMWMSNLTMTIISLAPFVAVIWRLLAADIRREFAARGNTE